LRLKERQKIRAAVILRDSPLEEWQSIGAAGKSMEQGSF
jgi:hypothetical protein